MMFLLVEHLDGLLIYILKEGIRFTDLKHQDGFVGRRYEEF